MSLHPASTFEQPGVWDSLSAREAQRIDATLGLAPAAVESLLDVGCGDGRFLHALVGRSAKAVGLDRYLEPLRRVAVSRVNASADSLPFSDGSFDLVVATEILEHLPIDVYRMALAEMSRVSRGRVLISVPLRENLLEELCWCESCDSGFHRYGHTRSFEEATLQEPVAGLAIERLEGIVPIRKSRRVVPLYWAQQRLGHVYQWDPLARCPRCGAGAAPSKGNALGRLAQRVIWRLDRHLPRKEDGWLVAVYRKQAVSKHE